MANVLPISLRILTCFLLSVGLLNRYGDMVNNNIITIVGVFISWFFSFIVVFLLPTDLTSTAYRQCLYDYQATMNSTTTTISPIVNMTSHAPAIIPQNQAYATLIAIEASNNFSSHHDIQNPCTIPYNYVQDTTLSKLWRLIYWTSQFLTWIVLPIMQSYSMAGDFTTIEKFKSALRANLIYYSTIGSIFMVLLVYVMFKNGLDFASLKVIAISSSNTWGLFLLVILLGYGLVELPRFLINQSRYSQSLNRQYFRVARVNAEKLEAEEKLDDVLEEINQAFAVIGNSEPNSMRYYLMQIVEKCPPDWKKRSNAVRRQASASNSTYDTDQSKIRHLDLNYMIKLHKKVIGAVHQHRQVICKWDHIIKEVIEWEDVARNQLENRVALESRYFKSTLPKQRTILHAILTPKIEWVWKCQIRVALLRATGIMMAAFSIAVVWSEIAFPISVFSPKLSIFSFFVDTFQESQQYFYLELFSTISIGYLAVCAFYTVFHMKIYNVYYLAPNSQTDEYSLLFSGMLLCRLAAPLCLNYLCLINRDSHIIKRNSHLETSFTTIMGHLDLIPIINSGLNVFLPLCISAICLAIYMNFGTHLLHSLGFEQFIESDEMTMDWVETGRNLVRRETGKLLRNYDSTQSGTYREMVPTTVNNPAETKIKFDTGAAENEHRGINPPAMKDSSISESSSSSSGFSRSSLLSRKGQQDLKTTGATNSKFNSENKSGLPGPSFGSDSIEDNVIDLGSATEIHNPEVRKEPGGFFDDI